MRVFDFASDTEPPDTAELERRSVESEWQLESWLLANPEVILDERLLIFGRQYGLDSGFPDLLALDRWGNVVVIEIKKGQSGTGSASEGSILSQPQEYAQSLSGYGYNKLDAIYDELKTKVWDGEWNLGDAGVIEESLAKAHKTAFGIEVDESAYNQHQRMVILAEQITRQTESNARYLLEQGLNVQCVAVQWFAQSGGDDRSLAEDYAVLGSSTVVDYPRSRVQPEDDTVDYSDLLVRVRDHAYPQLKDELRLEDRTDIASRSTKRTIFFGSNHPDHPKPLKYTMDPQIEEEGFVHYKLDLWQPDSEQDTVLREFLRDQTEQLEGYSLTANHATGMSVVERKLEVGVGDVEIVSLAQELVDLVSIVHSAAVDEFHDHEAF
ncbi:hypothetical protein U4E84_03220 [Halorubrum sp. AD140]|uniref:hypothetical protein n=1 Tax=Halorubrum sp. AD140 TaxID=3050073 RepID=UPI002ACC52A8|nr:hypothetical protein [Halorubrum sp. AD140]MDZ5810364.1 hypothetical protein [Halorubrum sp. AD140]